MVQNLDSQDPARTRWDGDCRGRSAVSPVGCVTVLLLLTLLLASCGDEPAPTAARPVVPAWAKVAPEQIAEADKHGVPVAIENDLGMRFVLIPAGTFLVGSPSTEAGHNDDETQHEVTLTRPYYIQTTEVTNAQFRSFRPDHNSGDFNGRCLNGAEQPVGSVSWVDAVAFAKWLGKKDPSRSYRLPTEAVWERACRAGTSTAYWWGNSISPDLANYYDGDLDSGLPSDPGFRVTVPVGTLPASPWGLHEVHGNVREWCADWFANGDYPPGPAMDPRSPDTGAGHLTRGGAYGEAADMVRAAFRIGVQGDDEERSYVGFRLVSPLPEPGEGGR